MSNHTPKTTTITQNISIVLFDGGSQEDGQQGAAAAILLIPHGRRYTVSQLVSFESQDEAKYMGLIIGLRKARSLGIRNLAIKGDSKVVFEQMTGKIPIPNQRIEKLQQKAINLMQTFEQVSLEWITPENNRSARSAVERCLKEALSNRKKPSQTELMIAQLRKKGDQCQDADFRYLKAVRDQWTEKSLSQLRTLVPLEVQDAIALRWKGGEDHLAQMYRWYLRGLPPDMASRKVNVDLIKEQEALADEKLPWEEALMPPPNSPLSDSELDDPLLSLFSDLNDSESHPLEPWPIPKIELDSLPSLGFSEATPNLKPQVAEDPLGVFLLDDPPLVEKATELLNAIKVDLNDITLLETPTPKISEPPITDPEKDALPSTSEVTSMMEQINNLPIEKKMILAQELVNNRTLITLILKVVADQVSA